MADRRRLQRDDGHGEESETGTAAAALKNASLSTLKKRKKKATGSTVSSYLIPSCASHGAISTINALAVINTVLRQPMARKRSGGGGQT